MKIGTDIVHIPRFEKLMQNEAFIKKVFHKSEIKDYRTEHLAGIFAAKESFFKAIDQKIDWLKVEVDKKKSGKPTMQIAKELKVQVMDLSISHDKDYAMATVLIKDER